MPIDPVTAYNQYFGPNPPRALYNKGVSQWYGTETGTRKAKITTAGGSQIKGTAVAGSTKMELRLNWLHHRSAQEQFELDTAMWYGAYCNQGDHNKEFMILRIFLVLHYGGLFFQRDHAWSPWSGSGIPLASALSHGGRVLVQLPPGQPARDFWNWLWGPLNSEQNHRSAATHGATYNKRPEVVRTKLKFYKEDKLGSLSPRAQNVFTGYQYGLNIGLGGVGNLNPFSGLAITAAGEHGHLYLYFRPEKDHNSLCMIACEDSAPMDRYNGTLRGLFRGDFATGQTGHAHKFGGSGAFSGTGGKKWEQRGWTTTGPDDKVNGMFIDLSQPADMRWVIAQPFNADFLGDDGDPTLITNVSIPTYQQWLNMSSVTLSSRDTAIKGIDLLMQQAERAPSADVFRRIKEACELYIRNPSANKDRVPAANCLLQQLKFAGY